MAAALAFLGWARWAGNLDHLDAADFVSVLLSAFALVLAAGLGAFALLLAGWVRKVSKGYQRIGLGMVLLILSIPAWADYKEPVDKLVQSLLKGAPEKVRRISFSGVACTETAGIDCAEIDRELKSQILSQHEWRLVPSANKANGVLQASVEMKGQKPILKGQLWSKRRGVMWEESVELALQTQSRSTVLRPQPTSALPHVGKWTQAEISEQMKVPPPPGVEEMELAAGLTGSQKLGMLARAWRASGNAIIAAGKALGPVLDRLRPSPPKHWYSRVDVGAGWSHLWPQNETFARNVGELNTTEVLLSWADLVTLGGSYGFKDGVDVNSVKAVSTLGLSVATMVPWHLGDFCTVYGGVGGRFENLALASDYLPDGTAAFGNSAGYGVAGIKLRLWNIGLNMNFRRDLVATNVQDWEIHTSAFWAFDL